MILTMLAAAALQAAPRPSDPRTFRDWVVGCDNGRACQAVALMPENGDEGATMAISRGPQPNAVPVIWVTVRSEGVQSPEALEIDGRRFPFALHAASQELRVRDGLAAAQALGQATNIAAVGPGNVRVPVSSSGSAAALLYMDEQQRRLGTTSALVHRGPGTQVPAPPPLLVVQRPPVPRTPARTLTPARVRQLLGREATVCTYAQDLEIEAVRLDARSSLVLASHPCGNGAYNFVSSAFIVDERGQARPARFDMEQADNQLYGAGWDPETRRLGSFFKGRGIGDCGSSSEYAWNGTRFRLVKQRIMGECRGSTDFITVWRAAVR